jgi:hypothetical protein
MDDSVIVEGTFTQEEFKAFNSTRTRNGMQQRLARLLLALLLVLSAFHFLLPFIFRNTLPTINIKPFATLQLLHGLLHSLCVSTPCCAESRRPDLR